MSSAFDRIGMWYSRFNPDLAKTLLFRAFLLSTAQIQYRNHDQYNVRNGLLTVPRHDWEGFGRQDPREPGRGCGSKLILPSPPLTSACYICPRNKTNWGTISRLVETASQGSVSKGKRL